MLSITSVPGIKVGHASAHNTGCTAVLCTQGMVPGVAVPGLAPGSRETDLMRPESTVQEIHGICLSGGSAFGLSAASGVMRFLAEEGHGLDLPVCKVPLVPGAVIYDFFRNQKAGILPDERMGYNAAQAATSQPVPSGPLGAGAGAACGMIASQIHPTGLGSYGMQHNDIIVAALVVNNAMGSIFHPENGLFLRGAVDGKGLPLSEQQMLSILAQCSPPLMTINTVLAVVATNARLDKVATNRLAAIAASGIALAVRPSNLLFDGDIVFALAAKQGPVASENLLGAMARKTVAMAIAASVGAGW